MLILFLAVLIPVMFLFLHFAVAMCPRRRTVAMCPRRRRTVAMRLWRGRRQTITAAVQLDR